MSPCSRILVPLLLLCVIPSAAAPGEERGGNPPGKEAALEWLRQPGAALRRSLQRRSEILAVFGGKSCPWCRRLEEDTLKSSRVRGLLAARVLLQVDVDGSPEIARSLGILSIPDIRLFNSEGIQLARHTGFLPAEELAAWIERGSRAEPRPDEPSLKALRPDPILDPYLQLEADGALPGAEAWQVLLAMAAGPSGETRAEALRLIKLWASSLAGGLVESLESPRLKVRLAAREALLELGAPVETIDPYARPAAGATGGAIAKWLSERAGPEAPARAVAPLDEKDIEALEDGDADRRAAARDRLVAAGHGIVERLRERGRTLRAAAPTSAARIDEVRFRILLPPQVVRGLPDASERLASGDAAARTRALSDVLDLNVPGLGPLLREALCDPDPFFRETAAASAHAILGDESTDALASLLADPEPNVRTAALKALARAGAAAAQVIARYLETERDPALIGHATRALQEVGGEAASAALRPLLESEHWSVRATAAEALGKMKDGGSLPRLLILFEDPDLFVASQAIVAAGTLVGQGRPDEIAEALAKAVDRRSELAVQALRVLSGSAFRQSKKGLEAMRSWARHGDAEVRAAAVEALAAARDSGARDVVLAGLEDADVRVRRATVAGVRSFIEKFGPGLAEEARPALVEGLAGDDPALRLECALTLIHAGDLEEARSVWQEFLLGADAELRARALLGFQWLASETVLERVSIDLWDAAPAAEREQVLQAISWNERGVDPVSSLLALLPRVPESSRPAWVKALLGNRLRSSAVEGEGGDRKNLRARLMGPATASVSDADRALLEALALGLGGSQEYLVSRLADPRAIIRRAALAALFRRRLAVPVSTLEALARDPEPEVRSLALYVSMPPELRGSFMDDAREWLGGGHVERSVSMTTDTWQEALPDTLLLERLRDGSAPVRLRAAALLAWKGTTASEEAFRELHSSWRAEPSFANFQLILWVLRRKWDDRRLPVLEEIYEAVDPNDSTNLEFVRSLVDDLGESTASLRERILRERGPRTGLRLRSEK